MEIAMIDYQELHQQIKKCPLCRLSETRKEAVPGEGSLSAEIMFIGEGPGYNEDRQGRPFVGQAGHLLNELLASVGLKREDVYITNMVKCRPPNNCDPQADEIKACVPYLDRQIELIAPKVIVALGRHSFGKFFPGESISKARGKPRRWKDIVIYPMYHPAAALHNSSLRPALEKDFANLLPLVEQVRNASKEPEQEAPKSQQLSMF
jgi:uracil-DNA glycosylase family 4